MRLTAREAKVNEVFDVRLEDFDALTRSYEPPTELRSADLVAVDTEQPFQTTVAETFKRLSQGAMRRRRNRMKCFQQLYFVRLGDAFALSNGGWLLVKRWTVKVDPGR